MKRDVLVKLAIGTAVAVALALWAGSTRGPVRETQGVGEPLVKGMASTLNDVSQLRVVEAGDKVAVTLHREKNGWVVVEREGYSADVAKVRETLIKFAEANLVEAKTTNPERYAALGVEDVSKSDAKGMRIDIDGKVAAKIVVGNFSAQGNGTFVRRNDEPGSWLVKGNLVVDRQASNWLDKDLVDLASDRIMRVEIRRGEQTFAVSKSSPEQVSFAIENLPKGREILSEYEANGIGSVLAGLKFDDVAKSGTATPESGSEILAVFQTFDGLIVEVAGFTANGKRYATLKASIDDARVDLAAKAAQLNARAEFERSKAAEGEGKAAKAGQSATEVKPPQAVTDPEEFIAEQRRKVESQADTLNQRVQGWVYVLPAYKYANMDKRLEDLLKPKT